ncbi:four-carbon acid sugar kinase family protein, partial [Desulfosarcina sp.]|uniref:four-carbon acid sugar kinase family protein n=1 Tax=Desulfosarcina sp. TaxID=2027861 RepID=UPI003970F8E9
MTDAVTTHAHLLETLPPNWPEDLFPAVRRAVVESATRLVILDDDPTGTQTVHGMPVLTNWSAAALEKELSAEGPGFFILTNSRSLTAAAAETLNREIGANLRRAITATGIPVEVISRSDSTLRGHFPGEMDALMEAMGDPDLPRILVPCFFEGGRLTVNDIHYVAERDQLIPAAQTPYARDAAFGYSHSNLRDWVMEKTGGAVPGDRVASVTISDIRLGGPHRVAHRLNALTPGSCCIVNALDYRDLTVFVAGLLTIESLGRRFVFRSAASFVRVRAGVPFRDLLARAELTIENGRGGLFVVGSYVPKTSAQLAALLQQEGVVDIEVKVTDLLDGSRRPAAIAAAVATANRALEKGRDAVLFTSRDLVAGGDAQSSL